MTHRGFITLHRKLTEWEWYKDVPTFKLFTHLLLSANHKPKKWKGIFVNRGEIITGRFDLARDTGLSEQEVRTAKKKLKSTNEIAIKATNKYSIIKLVNYSLYQTKKEVEQPADQPTTQPTSNQQATTTNNVNHVNNLTTPLTPPNQNNVNNFVNNSEKGVLKNVKEGKKINSAGELIIILSETALLKAKKNAERWDIYHLANVYVEGIEKRGMPDNLNKAFPSWCKKYTKGKTP